MKCYYHSADLDGQCSGAIVKYLYPDCELIGIDYGQFFPWDSITDRDESIWMVDFSLQPWSDMIKLNKLCTNVVWIDHHKTAIDQHTAGEFPLFNHWILNTEFSACELTWKFLFPEKAMPQAVKWLGRYDVWKHQEPGNEGSLEFQYGMRLYDTRPERTLFWRGLFESDEGVAIQMQGELLIAYEKIQNEKFIKTYGFETTIDGLKCICANRGMSNSLLFESVWDPEKYDAMMMFAWKDKMWTVSLYTDKPGIDVSEVAKRRGGGGHVGASGFQCGYGELHRLIGGRF